MERCVEVGVSYSESPIVAATAKFITTTMSRERPTLRMAARALNTSPRSLQRMLDQAGVSFSELLTQLESGRACELLHDPTLHIRQISRSLGYRDPSSFSRAFRNWTGASPRDYRRRLK